MIEVIIETSDDALKNIPKKDLLIRCKDCVWHSGKQHCVQFGLVGFEENDFCSYAERKKTCFM